MSPVTVAAPAEVAAPAGPHAPRGEARRVQSFDGMRGLGMICVLARHVAMELPNAPFRDPLLRLTSLGISAMDMFFVMSGFLITGLLYDAKSRPNYFRNYFARRCLRVFPLYYATLLILFVVIPLLPITLPDDYAVLMKNQGWYWTYTTNILITLTRGTGTPLFTGHFWSLAVEEQFYLVWPLLLWFLSRRGILMLCVGCIVTAVLFRAGLHEFYGAEGVYVLTPGRLDALAFGGILAIFSRDPEGMRGLARKCVTPFWISLALMAVIVVHAGELNRRDPYNYIFGYSIVAVMYGCLLVMLAATPASRITRFVGHPVLARLGQHSYAMYLAHYPLLGLAIALVPPGVVVAATGGSALPAFVLYGVVLWTTSYVVALGAWHLFERRLLDLKRFFPSPAAIRQDAADAVRR